MLAKVRWDIVNGDDDSRWRNSCGLYAYLTTDGREILYLGKVNGCTVRQRWGAPDKMVFWRALERERKIFVHIVIVGEIELIATNAITPRLTREKLADIESLIIMNVQPWGNVAAKQSRIYRPGMRVTCTGAWPLREKTFHDVVSLHSSAAQRLLYGLS